MFNSSGPNQDVFINGTFAFPIHIIPFGVIVFLGGFISTVGNALILVGYFTVDEFRKHKCNVLIANLALADLLSSVHFVVVGCLALLGSLVDNGYLIMTNERCFYICISAVLSFNAGSFMIFAVGVDRMLATAIPVHYSTLPKTAYTLTLNLTGWSFGALNFLFAFLCKDQTSLVPACILPTALTGFAHDFWNKCNLAFVVLVVVTYAVAYKRLDRPHSSWGQRAAQNAGQPNVGHRQHRRLLNSMILVVVVYVMSWAVTMLVIFVVTISGAGVSVVFHVSMYVGILANVNVGCNFFIYYVRSADYRKEIKKALAGRRTSSTRSYKEHSRLIAS